MANRRIDLMDVLELFGDPLLASAGLDRLGDQAIVLTITGSSYRLTPRAKGEEGEVPVIG